MLPFADDAVFPHRLAKQLALPLPGDAARAQFQPELSHGRHFHEPPPWARAAAVLLLLYPSAGGWRIPLALRPLHLSKHAGQIALPGGSVERGETPQAAALRETEEEFGVPANAIQLLGALSPLYLYVTDFAVFPWVAFVPETPLFAPDPGEVQELIEVPLSMLLEDGCRTTLDVQRGQLHFRAPGLEVGTHIVWGATAMVMAEFLHIVRNVITGHAEGQ